MTKQAPTKKVAKLIDEGLTVNYGSGYIAVASEREDRYQLNYDDTVTELAPYTISYHDGMMPSFQVDEFWTLQDLANAMRDIADLRTWTAVEYD